MPESKSVVTHLSCRLSGTLAPEMAVFRCCVGLVDVLQVRYNVTKGHPYNVVRGDGRAVAKYTSNRWSWSSFGRAPDLG